MKQTKLSYLNLAGNFISLKGLKTVAKFLENP
jgi:hypothetical protein